MSKTIYVLNGPSPDLLGPKEPGVEGSLSLEKLESMCRSAADQHGLQLEFRQTNQEGVMIDWLQEARQSAGIVINPGGFSRHSISVLDALLMCDCPVVEVHVSNIHRQKDEPWRAQSIMSAATTAVVTGLGAQGYVVALDFLAAKPEGAAA